MKVALVVPRDAPGSNNFHQVPIGSLYTAEQLRRQGTDVTFHDLRLQEADGPWYAEIAQADLAVVFSADSALAQCYPSLPPTAACVRQIHAAGGPLVACAGSHATTNAALTRQFTGADIAV